MKKFITAFIFTIFCIATANAKGEWILVDETSDALVYINTDISEEYGSYLVWQKWDYKKAKKTGSRKHAKYYWSTVYLCEYSKDFSKNRLRSYTKYSKSGKVVESASFEYGDWDYIVPDTVGETLAEAAQYIYENY